jgi:hypothetical protein
VSERFFRLILGLVLILLLYMQESTLLLIFIGIIFFEGLTNLRIPLIVSKILYGNEATIYSDWVSTTSRFNIDAERVLRFVIALLLILSVVIFPEVLWFIPWLIAFMLLGAGLTNICPMYHFLRWAGFRE